LGPIDPQIGLLRVDTAEGKPLALVYNFAGHPYGGVPDGGVTADFPGFASRVIEEAWPGAVAFPDDVCGRQYERGGCGRLRAHIGLL
jgi:hypothetical protein